MTRKPARTTTRSGRRPCSEQACLDPRRLALEHGPSVGRQYMGRPVAELRDRSRMPTRKAPIRLANEGLVEIHPRHGMRIKPVSREDRREDRREICEVLTTHDLDER